MHSLLHKPDYLTKLVEIMTLLRLQWIPFEEGNDFLYKIHHAAHPIRLPVTVVGSHHSTTEVLSECIQNVDIALVLDNGELRKHLISYRHLRMCIDADEEATFPINESHDPLRIKFHISVELNVKSLRVLP